MSELRQIQSEVGEWSMRNFGKVVIAFDIAPMLGMVEELGELSHAVLKHAQGIRGTKEEHVEAVKDSVADLFIFSLDFCSRNGIDAQAVLEEVWAKVKQRDWTANKQTGISE